MGLDSTNSSKPPSSDGYKKKTVAPALPRENHSKGGQEGHKGRTLKRVENPDRIELDLPEQCQCCGRVFNSDDPHDVIQNRQVFDLPEPKLEVTKHRIGQINCCWIEQPREFLPEVKAPVQYGPNNQAERDLREFKVKLKISDCFRTIEVARIYARIQAVISTFRKREESVFAKLSELFSPRSATV